MYLNRVGGDHDNVRAWSLLTYLRRQFPAIHARHENVQQKQVNDSVRQPVQRLCGGTGFQNLETQRGQKVRDQAAMLRLIVNHQQCLGSAFIADDPLADVNAWLCAMIGGQHQLQCESGAFAIAAGHRQIAAHQIAQQLGDGQPQPGAADMLDFRIGQTLKGLENPA